MTVTQRATYSRLGQILADRALTVAELERQLRARGARFDRKTLYRLAGADPVGRADISLIHEICDLLEIGLDDFFRFAPSLPSGEPDEYWQIPDDRIRRVNELGEKNNLGTISRAERRELADLVAAYESVMLHNAQVRLWREKPEQFSAAQIRANNI
jgi:DNA-binding Xre family transcriptional regulator